MKFVIFALMALSISACTNKSLYENIQSNNQFACNNVAASQYDDCMDRSSMSYEEYEDKRLDDYTQGGLDY